MIINKPQPIDDFVEVPIVFICSPSANLKQLTDLLPSFGMTVILVHQDEKQACGMEEQKSEIEKTFISLKNKHRALVLVEVFEASNGSSNPNQKRFSLHVSDMTGDQVKANLVRMYSSEENSSGFVLNDQNAKDNTLGQSLANMKKGVHYVQIIHLQKTLVIDLSAAQGDLSEIGFLLAGFIQN